MPPDLLPPELLPLILACAAASLAGLVDAIAGGGGLIQLPALMALYPASPLPPLFGTNKLASISGTGLALSRYLRQVPMDWPAVLPAAAAAFAGSFAGAAATSRLSPEFLRPAVLGLLCLVAAWTFASPGLGAAPRPLDSSAHRIPLALALLLGGSIGFYDGFFGPGTGSFLVFAFVRLGGMDFLQASAAAKLVNVGTNLAALCVFLPAGNVRPGLALAMMACNMGGSALGTRLALKHGAPLVRRVFQGVVALLIAKLAADLLG